MYKDNDAFNAKQYLLRSVSRTSFWKGWKLEEKQTAVSELNQLENNEDALNAWIGKWLSSTQKNKLDSAIRNARQRSKGKSITISEEAHRILKTLAEADKLSLSEVIEKRLNRAFQVALQKTTKHRNS